jgi:signal transduction histidine kinase
VWFANLWWATATLGLALLAWLIKYHSTLEQFNTIWDLASRFLFCLLIMFITDRLKRSYYKINAQKITLQQLEKMRQQFTYMLIHDLNAPLAKNSMALQILKRAGKVPEEHSRHLEVALASVEEMRRMILNLLQINNMREKGLTLNRQEFSMTALVENSVAAFGPIMEVENKSLTVEITGDIPPVNIDQDKMRRVIDNLIDNARKFTPSGGWIKFRVFFEPQGKYVCARIEDNGAGIEKETLKGLFIENAPVIKQQDKSGFGFGLSYCKMVVEGHGGFIRAESEGKGRGAKFTIALPAFEDQERRK